MNSTSSNTVTKKGPPVGQHMTSAPIPSDGNMPATANPEKINDFRGVHIDRSLFVAGNRLAVTMFNNRDFSPMTRYIEDANHKTDIHVRACGLSVLSGVGHALIDILANTTRAGWVSLTGYALPSMGELEYAFRTDADQFSALMNVLIKTAHQVGKALPSLKADLGERDGEAKKEEKPTKVEVVSLPTRETTSSIVRDANGNIVASTQRETDAA